MMMRAMRQSPTKSVQYTYTKSQEISGLFAPKCGLLSLRCTNQFCKVPVLKEDETERINILEDRRETEKANFNLTRSRNIMLNLLESKKLQNLRVEVLQEMHLMDF